MLLMLLTRRLTGPLRVPLPAFNTRALIGLRSSPYRGIAIDDETFTARILDRIHDSIRSCYSHWIHVRVAYNRVLRSHNVSADSFRHQLRACGVGAGLPRRRQKQGDHGIPGPRADRVVVGRRAVRPWASQGTQCAGNTPVDAADHRARRDSHRPAVGDPASAEGQG